MHDSGGGMIGMLIMLMSLFFCVAMLAAMWRIFTKAGQPGWACIIPIYNLVVMMRIVGLPLWTILLYFVPFVNLVASIYVIHRLALAFGKDVMWTVGMIFPFTAPFVYMALGFGDAQYKGAEDGGMGLSRF